MRLPYLECQGCCKVEFGVLLSEAKHLILRSGTLRFAQGDNGNPMSMDFASRGRCPVYDTDRFFSIACAQQLTWILSLAIHTKEHESKPMQMPHQTDES